MSGGIGPGEAELARAVEAYERALPPGARASFDIAPLDVLGLTVMVESFVGEPIGTNDGFGYGATALEARVGALGELNEVIALAATLKRDEGERGSFGAMRARHGTERVVDPLTLCLPAGSRYTADTELAWVLCHRLAGGEAYVPREFVAASRASFGPGVPLVTPITNGLGAGLTRAQALAHALLELLQRDGNAVRFRAMDRGIAIDLGGIDDPGLSALIARLHAHGIVPAAKLAATDFGLTNLYVVDAGAAEPPFALQATACGEAAHASPLRALRKALLEFMAARCRKALMHGSLEPIAAVAPPGYLARTLDALDPDAEEPRALQEMDRWVDMSAAELRALLSDTVLATRDRVAFADLPGVADAAVADPAARLADLSARLGEAGLDVLFYEASAPDAEVQVVKAIVPRLECETMSYHRIGARGVARLMADGTGLAGLGSPPPGAAPVRLDEADTERLGGPAWLDVRGIDARVGALYPLYREPSSHTVQLARQRRAGG